MLFLDSLEDWTVIEKSLEIYKKSHITQKIHSGVEFTLLVLVCIVEFVYMKRLMKNDVILIWVLIHFI